MLRAPLIPLLVSLLAPTAAASPDDDDPGVLPEARRARPEIATPQALSVYGADDPLAAEKDRIESMLGLYQLVPARRHHSERVVLKGRRARIYYWQPVASASDQELKTQAVRWFVLGRTQYAPGVRGIFSELAEIDEVQLIFHEVLRPGKRGRRRGREKVSPYLMIRLAREAFATLDIQAVRACAEEGNCSRFFARGFSGARFNARYTQWARARWQ